MATVITKKSTTSGAVPVAADLVVGELAVNTADAKLYTKHTDNSIVRIGKEAQWTTYEFDIGLTPRRAIEFNITDASVTATSTIQVLPTSKPATGRWADDYEWDMGMFSANPGTGEFTVTAYFTGRVTGKRNLQYKVQ